jgi:hypothetical protein
MIPKLRFGYQTSDQERYERESYISKARERELHIKSERERATYQRRERERERERERHTHTHTHKSIWRPLLSHGNAGKPSLLSAPKLGFGQESVKEVPVFA